MEDASAADEMHMEENIFEGLEQGKQECICHIKCNRQKNIGTCGRNLWEQTSGEWNQTQKRTATGEGGHAINQCNFGTTLLK